MLRSLTIGRRISMALVGMVLFIALICLAFLYNAEVVKGVTISEVDTLMLEGQKSKIKVATDSLALSLSKQIEDTAGSAAKIELIRKALKSIRFEEDKSGYYFVFEGTVTIAHAAKPSLHGKDLGKLKDKNGVFMIRELSDVAKKGGGFVEYVWPKPEAGDQPKISYSTMIPGSDYFIGTGVYIDNIQQQKALVANEIDGIVKQNTTLVIGALVAVLICLVLPLSVLVVRSITGPILEAARAAESIAEGDLSVALNVQGKDEAAKLQKSLNSMARTLQENIDSITIKTKEAEEKARAAEVAMREVTEARAEAERARKEGILQAADQIQTVVDRVSDATGEITQQVDLIDRGTTVQRDRVQGTATAMEEMNSTVLEVARNASEAASMGVAAKDQAVEGADIVHKSVDAMNTTYHAAEDLKDGMNRLGSQADEIGQVLTVITDIADQTNLLALNAAIEAARAGEAGRGFAVVADEVRKLAEKTMQATKEVGKSISAVQDVAQRNISGMEKALSDLNTAVELSNQSGSVLKSIVQGAEDSAMQIQSIATAAEEQSAASEEITQAIDDINAISMETSQGAADSAEALQDLARQMVGLQSVIDSLVADAKS